jgi:hypothetical protein
MYLCTYIDIDRQVNGGGGGGRRIFPCMFAAEKQTSE